MIRVVKGSPPAYLKRASGPAVAKLKAMHTAGKAPTASKSIYGNGKVRCALAAAQHGKCCYCEVKIPVPYAYQHVEHFRPQGQSRQDANDTPNIPGYYWLAYEWNNLFIACVHCNSAYKKDFFPLRVPKNRALRFTDDIAAEEPLLIEPSGTADPVDHIEFHDEIPKGITEMGRATVAVVGLDCPAREDRLEYLNHLRRLHREIIALTSTTRTQEIDIMIKDRLRDLIRAARPESPYSSMAKSFLRSLP